MTIIDQLEKALTPVLLGKNEKHDVAAISLLEQFYALLVARLASADIYSQLLRNQAIAVASNSSLFEQLWPNFESRQLITDELSVTHHIDEVTCKQLVTKATHLGYQELQNLANSQFLPAFLQLQQATIRQYLPVWASTVILAPMPASKNEQKVSDQLETIPVAVIPEAVVSEQGLPKAVILDKQHVEDSYELGDLSDIDIIDDSSAIHANPAAYRPAKDGTNSRFNSSWLIPLLLLVIAMTALALLWFLVIQPKYMQPAPVVVEPIVIVPEVPTASELSPIELIIAVDDSGGLYSCNATIGDIALQNALQQALNTSFAEQAGICELRVQQGVATTVSAIDIKSLPKILTLVRSVPFARMQLQNNSLDLMAPDEGLLQQLLVNIRALLPNISVTTTASLDNYEQANDYNEMSNIDNANNESNFDNIQSNDEFMTADNNRNINNSSSDNQSYQQSDNDSYDDYDQVIPAPPRSSDSSVNRFNNSRQAGPISEAEAENLANIAIVAEPLRNARPVDRSIGANN